MVLLFYTIAALFGGYLLGSIPFGLLFGRLAGVADIRKTGSGNIGATNVLRTGKRWAALATLLCDGAKGAAAVLIAGHYVGPTGAIYAGLGAFLGHVYPFWLRFRGGKGMATFIGVTLGLAWPVGAGACATWLAVALLFRFSSLATLITALATPFYFWWAGLNTYALLAGGLEILIFYTHRANIGRLFSGKEPKIGAKF